MSKPDMRLLWRVLLIVYADLLFLINFSVDYIALYITGRLMSCRTTAPRLCAASALGAAFAVIALLADAGGFLYFIVSAAVTAAMCICAFKRAGLVGYIGATVLLFAVGAAIGGVVSAVISFGGGASDISGSDAADMAEGDAGMILFVVITGAAVLVYYCGRAAKRHALTKRRCVTITDNGKTVCLDALCDSGNLLREPISGRAAVIISADALKGVLPDEIIAASRAESAESAMGKLPARLLGKVRLLPATGVGGGIMLIGYRPDEMTVDNAGNDKQRRHGGKRCVDGVIAVTDKRDFAGCDAVLPVEFI